MKVAVSAEDSLFKQNRILNKAWAKNYPGASWLPILKNMLEPDFALVTADVALDHVNQGFWDAAEVFVIQHGIDEIADRLIKEGAVPLALTCFESPLYIGDFYCDISNIAPKFKHRILFSGLHERYKKNSGVNHNVTFPSFFSNNTSVNKIPWDKREFMVAVIGNKYLVPSCCPSLSSPLEWFWWVRKKLLQLLCKSFPSGDFPVKTIQLQDLRLEAICFFMERNLLDLYGRGWRVLGNLPPRWQTRMKPVLKRNPAKACSNKLETIKNYKFGLCIENAKFPGYVTEKIIDCFVSGVIPIYVGAPDVELYIPKSCFINLSDYKTIEELLKYLQVISESDAIKMISSGQDFLESKQGKQYSYEGFAKFIADIVRAESKAI